MLFSRERVKPRINQSKSVLAVPGYNAIFERISKTKNHQVNNSVKSAQGTMLFYKEGARQ